MRQLHRRRTSLKLARLATASAGAALLSSLIVPSSTETAAANGDTRTLYLYHSHTGESIQATFRVNGSYDPVVLDRLNHFLRDWRNNDVTRMDPRLFDVIWEVYRTAGVTTQPIVIVSAYRSPQTNAMLRRRSSGVAEHSQHILGHAMDTTMPGMSMERIREIGMRLQRGGVGWYPSSNFVHLDVGGVRAWPRMSYDQLVRLFPDGKTVHLAADGRTLPHYAEARAEIAARGGVMSDVAQAAPSPFGGMFAWLFGKQEGNEEAEAQQNPRRFAQHGRHGTEVASAARGGENPAQSAPSTPANRASNHGPGTTPAEAQGERTRVADLSATPGSGLGQNADDDGPNAQPEQDAQAHKAKIELRAGTVPAPLPPIRPAQAESHVGVAAADVPLPPARPSKPGFAIAYADVPTPPVRPVPPERLAAATLQNEGSAQQTTQAGAQALDAINVATRGATGNNSSLSRAARLPVLITQGTAGRVSVPKEVLAFAAPETPAQEVRAQPASATPSTNAARAVTPAQTTIARSERSKPHASASAGPEAFPAPSILGQRLAGLRQAARIIPDVLSAKPSSSYVTSFGIMASDLDCSHFSGAAMKPLTFAAGFDRPADGKPAGGEK